jgi:hypothetical protein
MGILTRIPLPDDGTGILVAGLHPEMPAMTAAGLLAGPPGPDATAFQNLLKSKGNYFFGDRRLDRVYNRTKWPVCQVKKEGSMITIPS